MKKVFIRLFLLLSALFFVGCSSDNSRYLDTSKTLQSVQITPALYSLPKGLSLYLKATAYFDDGSAMDVTNEVIWNSTQEVVLSVETGGNNPGYAYAALPGEAMVTATLFTQHGEVISNTSTITVTDATLENIVLSPTQTSVPKGVHVRYKAYGYFSDRNAYDITRIATFSSSDESVATTSKISGLEQIADTLNEGNTTITATFKGIKSNDAQLEVTSAVLTSLQITPPQANVPTETVDNFTAVAYFSDGSSNDVTKQASWSSDETAIVSIVPNGEDGGLAHALKHGTAHITATFGGIKSNTATVTVTGKALTSIHLVPAYTVELPKGTPKTYKVWAYYDDGTSKDVTALSTLSTADTGIATMETSGEFRGRVHAIEVGETLVQAEYKGMKDTAPLKVVSPALLYVKIFPEGNMTVPVDTQENFKAMAYYSDGVNKEITEYATWNTTDSEVVSIVPSGADGGLAYAASSGDVNITATYKSKTSDRTSVKVVGKTIKYVQIVPNNETIFEGEEKQYRVFVIYDDYTQKEIGNQVRIQSLQPNIAIVDKNNIVHGVIEGTAELSVTFEGVQSEQAFVHVVPVPVTYTIKVVPEGVRVPHNAEGNFHAIKYNSDGTQEDITDSVTWSSSESTIVDINATGYAKADANNTGTATITATDGSVSADANVTVTDKSVKNIQITPNNVSVTVDEKVKYEVSVIYEDHTIEDVTPFATLQSLGPNYADFINHDTLLGKKAGAAELKATWFGFVSEREFVHISE